jgi:hypothetical protein
MKNNTLISFLRCLVESLNLEFVSLFGAVGHFAVFAKSKNLALDGVNFRKIFREAGLNNSFFVEYPTKKLHILWSIPEMGRGYSVEIENPVALTMDVKAVHSKEYSEAWKRIADIKTSDELNNSPHIAILFEKSEIENIETFSLLPHLLGVPVYAQGKMFDLADEERIGWLIKDKDGSEIFEVFLNSSLDEVLFISEKQVVLSEETMPMLPIVINSSKKNEFSSKEIMGKVISSLRQQFFRNLPWSFSTSEKSQKESFPSAGVSATDFFSKLTFKHWKKIKNLTMSDRWKYNLISQLTGMGVKNKLVWGGNKVYGFTLEPSRVYLDPITIKEASAFTIALFPNELPFVAEKDAPVGSKTEILEIIGYEGNNSRSGMNFIHFVDDIRAGEYSIPFLATIDEINIVLDGENQAIWNEVYISRSGLSFPELWESISSNQDLVKAMIQISDTLGFVEALELEQNCIRDIDEFLIDPEFSTIALLLGASGFLNREDKKFLGQLSKSLGGLSLGIVDEVVDLKNKLPPAFQKLNLENLQARIETKRSEILTIQNAE